jgi:DNA-binding beta-propeller fold protein YncE
MGSPGKAPGQFDQPHGIAVDSAGAIYVAEVANQRVQKFVKKQ